MMTGMTKMLMPVLVAAYGRSGTTALMSLLSQSPAVAMGREYPFEERCLTYLAKAVLASERQAAAPALTSEELCDFDFGRLGSYPRASAKAHLPAPDAVVA